MPYDLHLPRLKTAQPWAWNVFLSSTVKDLESYRKELKDTLYNYQVSAFLGEDWAGGFNDIRQLCKDRIEGSDGYLLVVGHWYGSIPPESEISITHLEFEWARARWSNQYPIPMAAYLPELLSEADTDLRAKALPLLPEADEERRVHDHRLESFRRQLTGSWRNVERFKNLGELKEKVVAFCNFQSGATFGAAAKGEVTVTPSSKLGDKQLGHLGRSQQIEMARKVLAQLEADPGVPAACLMVTGDEDAGQTQMLAQLLGLKGLSRGRPAKIGRPIQERYDLAVLVQWTARSLGLESADLETPEDLAERIAGELKKQPLVLALEGVHRFSGGVPSFQREFWRPLYDRLSEIRATHATLHRLFAIVTEYTGNTESWNDHISSPTFRSKRTKLEPIKVILLPHLAGIEKGDLLLWFDEMDIPDLPPGRRLKLAASVLLDPNGNPDPTPRRVFNRLQGATLWPEDDE